MKPIIQLSIAVIITALLGAISYEFSYDYLGGTFMAIATLIITFAPFILDELESP